MTKQIPLTRGAYALVDDDDYDWLMRIGTWCLTSKGYAVHYQKNSTPKKLYMHRAVMNASGPIQVDHINRDRLDNRRENLRFATRSQNQANQGRRCHNTSGYKGVTRNHKRWTARIRYQGKRLYLGNFSDPRYAARVYDAASRLLYAEFAGVNFPERDTPRHIEQYVQQRIASYNKSCAA